MNKSIITTLLSLSLCLFAQGQSQVPAAAQSTPIVIVNSTLHLGNGSVIKNGMVYFDKGIIEYAGVMDDEAQRKYLRKDVREIDGLGRHVYPSLIALDTYLGLNEIDAVRATRDYNEVGENNPNVRAIIAYNTDSKVTPTVKVNGILMAEIKPTGGRISGTGSLVQLDAWNWEDAAVFSDLTLHLNWPVSYYNTGWWAEPGETVSQPWENDMLALTNLFDEAFIYAHQAKPEVRNLKYEAMKGLFDGSKKLFIHANDRISISSAVTFAKKYKIAPVIVGGADAWMIADELKEAGAAVVITRTHRLPQRPDEAVDIAYRLPSLLQEKGVLYAIADINGWEQRNLPFQAGTAAAYGLSSEQALTSITLNPAKILGMEKQVGSLEKGKRATLFISEGDALDMKGNKIYQAFIDGRDIGMINDQQLLYFKFKQKYGLTE